MADEDKSAAEKPGHGLGYFFGRWRKIVARLNKKKIRDFARRLAKEQPKASARRLAKHVVRRSARHSAVLGLAAASPSLVPGLGTAISIAAVVPEEIYLIRKTCVMLLQIAAVYGFDPTEEDRLYEIIALAGTPPRFVEMLMTARGDLQRMAMKSMVIVARQSSAHIAESFSARGVFRRLPALGFLVGGVINYISLRGVGKRGIRFYERLRRQTHAAAAESEVEEHPVRGA